MVLLGSVHRDPVTRPDLLLTQDHIHIQMNFLIHSSVRHFTCISANYVPLCVTSNEREKDKLCRLVLLEPLGITNSKDTVEVNRQVYIPVSLQLLS